MSKKEKQTNPFIQTPINKTRIYEFNDRERVLELVDYRDDVKYIQDNKNLTFKEMLEKYGPNFYTGKNNGFAVDDTLIYKDINNMWNDGQNYQRKLKELKETTPNEVVEAVEEIKNIEVNKEVKDNETTNKQ